MDAELAFAVRFRHWNTVAKHSERENLLNVNQWNTVNDVFPFSLLQPPLVVPGGHPALGWEGKAWAYRRWRRQAIFLGVGRGATGELLWEASFIPEELVPAHLHGQYLDSDDGGS